MMTFFAIFTIVLTFSANAPSVLSLNDNASHNLMLELKNYWTSLISTESMCMNSKCANMAEGVALEQRLYAGPAATVGPIKLNQDYKGNPCMRGTDSAILTAGNKKKNLSAVNGEPVPNAEYYCICTEILYIKPGRPVTTINTGLVNIMPRSCLGVCNCCDGLKNDKYCENHPPTTTPAPFTTAISTHQPEAPSGSQLTTNAREPLGTSKTLASPDQPMDALEEFLQGSSGALAFQALGSERKGSPRQEARGKLQDDQVNSACLATLPYETLVLVIAWHSAKLGF